MTVRRLQDLNARQILLMLTGIVITGCFIRGIMSFREGRIGLGISLLFVALLLSLFFRKKIAILYIGLLFLLVNTSMTAVLERSQESLVASIVLGAAVVALVRWDVRHRSGSEL